MRFLATTWMHGSVRGLALFAGSFLVANGVLGTIAPRFDATVWLVDLRWLAPVARAVVEIAAGGVLVAWGLGARQGGVLRTFVAVVAGALAVAASVDAVRVLRLDADGLATGIPMSIGVALAFAGVALAAARSRPTVVPARATALVVATACALALPVAQVLVFGRTDYRRDADAIVVFGARAYADGRPSLTLADRVRTACALWREGRAPTLFLSGGPGDGDVHETAAMRRLALSLGVPADAIELDEDGVDTRSTVEHAAQWAASRGFRRVLAVSHAYHLPRVKLEFDRAGVAAFTVPAHESRFVAKTPWFVAREVAAWWRSWLLPVTPGA